MSEDYSLKGRVALITGGGGALGRAYALEFAKRGASVVVNDLGVAMKGGEKGVEGENPAEKVVKEIIAMGGKAIANFDSVTEGEKIVAATIKAFGRIDILINNAGNLRDVSFIKMTDEDWNSIQRVHVQGAYKVTKAAWPYMREQKYGRIINTSSAAGLYGNFGQVNYSSAKLSLVGFSLSLSKEGEKFNIKCNCIAPLAASRMTESILSKEICAQLRPEFVVPLVVYLSHDSCNLNGQIFEIGGGWISMLRWQRTKGITFPISQNKSFSPQDIHSNLKTISDFSNSSYPNSLSDSLGLVLENMKGSASPSPSPSKSSFLSLPLLSLLGQVIKADKTLVSSINSIFVFHITKGNEKLVWTIDLKNGSGASFEGEKDSLKSDATFELSDDNFVSMSKSKVNPQTLFTQGKLKIKGNLGAALKFEKLLKAIPSPSL